MPSKSAPQAVIMPRPPSFMQEPIVLIGYVSDERYVALADVLLEFIDAQGNSFEARSRASGAIHLDLPNGEYKVVLQKAGYGAKFSRVTLPMQQPHQFRL